MDILHRILHSIISHFIPHAGNDFRPRLLERVGMVGLLGLVLLSFTAANMQALLWQTSDYLVGAVLPAVVVDLTNKERITLTLPLVTRNALLDAAATLKAEDMAKNSYFSHDSPTGVTPWHWFEVAGYPFVHAGENLAVYFTDSDEVVAAWMASPTHRANIVNNQYREIGIGTARGMYKGFETVFVVQLFGTRALPAVVAKTDVPDASVLPVATSTLLVVTPIVETEIVVPTTTRDTQLASLQTPQVAGETIDTVTLIKTTETPQATPAEVREAETVVVPEPEPELTVTPAVVVPERVIVPGIAGAVPAFYLSQAASSTNLAPVPLSTIEYNGGTSAPMVARLATAPNRVLQLLYIIVGFFTGLALVTSVLLQWRQHRPVQTVYGIGMLILMCGLFYIHTMVTAGVVIL